MFLLRTMSPLVIVLPCCDDLSSDSSSPTGVAFGFTVERTLNEVNPNPLATLTVTGDGEQRRDFTHVEDIVDAIFPGRNQGITKAGEYFPLSGLGEGMVEPAYSPVSNMVPNYTTSSGVPAEISFSDQMMRDPKSQIGLASQVAPPIATTQGVFTNTLSEPSLSSSQPSMVALPGNVPVAPLAPLDPLAEPAESDESDDSDASTDVADAAAAAGRRRLSALATAELPPVRWRHRNHGRSGDAVHLQPWRLAWIAGSRWGSRHPATAQKHGPLATAVATRAAAGSAAGRCTDSRGCRHPTGTDPHPRDEPSGRAWRQLEQLSDQRLAGSDRHGSRPPMARDRAW